MSDIKIGQKRTETKRYQLKRSILRPISKKRQKEQPEYTKISNELKVKANYRSELSGDKPDWRGIQCHHINGRVGIDYIDPFNMIILTATEHDREESHKTYERKQELLSYIKLIRIAQGYNENTECGDTN